MVMLVCQFSRLVASVPRNETTIAPVAAVHAQVLPFAAEDKEHGFSSA